MTKQHFIALADECKQLRKSINYYADTDSIDIPTLFNKLADFCASQNPNFKRDRWLSYIAGECGKNGGSVKQSK